MYSGTSEARIGQLKWLTLFRVALVTTLLAATVVFSLQDSSEVSDRIYEYLYYLCTSVYLLSFGYTVVLRVLKTPSGLHTLTYVQFTGDVLFATALVLVTGGTDSAFTFFFSLVIISGAIILFRPGALYLATVSAVLFTTIGLIEVGALPFSGAINELRFTFVPRPSGLEEDIDRFYHAIYNVVLNGGAFFAVALLAAWLSEQLRSSAQQISSQRESLEQLRALHRDILNSMLTGLVTFGLDRRITVFNPAAQDITKLRSEDAVGRDVTEIFPDLGPVLAEATPTSAVRREESLLVLGRRKVYIGWSMSPLRDSHGQPTGHTFMFQDISRIKEMERSVQRSEKMAAIGQLAAGIAHEIRNPLAAISGSIQLLQASAPLDTDDRRLLDIVLRETEHLNGWISDFLEYSKPLPVDARPIDLDRLIDDALSMFRQDQEVAATAVQKHSAGPITVLGDESRLKQVLWNLLRNAVQASRGEGAVEISVGLASSGSMPQVELAVSDRGEGIPPEDLDRIFQPFFTTKERGTGLGLATVHRIVEEHHGRIVVESAPGRGSTFRVLLPLGRPEL